MNKLPNVDMTEVEEAREKVAEEQARVNMTIEEDLEEVMPEVKPRVTIEDTDIFGGGEILEEAEPPKQAKKKRVMSEAQKENLRKGREKALAVRRAKAQEKKDMKELESKVKQKKKQELVDYLDTGTGKKQLEGVLRNPPKIQPIKQEQPIRPEPTFDFEGMLEKGIKSALESHDSERKARKVKKVQEQRKSNETNKLTNMVMSAQRDPKYYGQNGFFDNCF